MKNIYFFFLFLGTFYIYSQENTSTSNLIEVYTNQLNLGKEQSKQFLDIIDKYNHNLKEKALSNTEFNKILKSKYLELYKILKKEQFNEYKKMSKKLEPQLQYRFD